MDKKVKFDTPRVLAKMTKKTYDEIAQELKVDKKSVYNWCRIDAKILPNYKKYLKLWSMANNQAIILGDEDVK